MTFIKGHTTNLGKKMRTRKTKAEEVQEAIGNITTEALIKLANSRVFGEISKNNSYNAIKDLSLPITLKGIKEVKDINIKTPKPLDDMLDLAKPETSQEPSKS